MRRELIMESSVFMCVILISLSYGSIAADWYGNSRNNYQPDEGYVTECNWNKGVILSKQMKDVRCMPRYTLVKLNPQFGFTYYPNYAQIKRCSGFCHANKSCMPVAATLKEVAVRMNGYNGKQCYNVLVEEHTKCKCQCSVKEEHCNSYQQYSEENCACECMKRTECDSSRQMIWNEDMCKCVCNKNEEDCSSGLEWVPSICRCAKVVDMYREM